MVKYPTRSALLKHREDAARSEVLARQERMQHQQEVEELKEKLANEVSARERDKEESMKQIEEIRKEFRSTLQQQIQLALQQVLTLEHSSPFFGSSIFANVPCLLGCTGYHRNHLTPHRFQTAQVSTTTSSHHHA